MRREIFKMVEDDARRLLVEAPYLHLAAVNGAGEPVLRALNFAPLGSDLCFHGAPAGEKLDVLGGRCVLSAVEAVALLPSTFSDAERACPASALYRSAQAHGRIERIDDVATKARALQALMERTQPQGGHVPIDATHARFEELYQREVKGVLVCRVVVERIDGKAKLAQNRTPAERAKLVEQLWRRGEPDDARAVELIARYNRMAVRDLPSALRGPPGTTLHAWLDPRRAGELHALFADGAGPRARAEWIAAHVSSAAWVGARDDEGRLVGSARAVSDRVRLALLSDVVVAPAWRERGLDAALLALLRDHAAVRGCARIELA